MTNLSEKSKERDLEISLPKTKARHIRKRPLVSPTIEEDIEGLPTEKKFKHECTACEMTYTTNHGRTARKEIARGIKEQRNQAEKVQLLIELSSR